MPTIHHLIARGRARVAGEACAIVERAREIIDVDVDLRRGCYYREHPGLCTGRRACAIGTLWLAAGIEPVPESTVGFFTLPGVGKKAEREAFLAERPALDLAYEAVNATARVYYDEHPNLDAVNSSVDYVAMDELMGDAWDSELEALFEETDIDVDGMRAVFATAAAALRREEA